MIKGFTHSVRENSIRILPGLMTFLLIMVGAVNFRIPGLTSFIPLFGAAAVFYWGVYRPDLLPKWLVFVIGFFQDSLYGYPPGVSSLTYLLLWWVVVSQRRYLVKEPFWVLWTGFVLVAGLLVFSNWVIMSLYFGQLFLTETIVMQYVFTVLAYPFIHLLFSTIHRHSPGRIYEK